MRISGAIKLLMASIAILPSCSIKEDRDVCPCFLDVTMIRRTEEIFQQDRAWCSVWEDGTRNVLDHVFEPVIGNECMVSCAMKRNSVTAVVISNIEPAGGRIAAATGSEMPMLYASRKDIECSGESASAVFDSYGKRYVAIIFRLDKDALPFRENLTITLDGPYDGLSLPSMTAHLGAFSCSSRFDEKGEAALRIPPQGGPGLKAGIRLDTNPPATMDLYRAMLDAGFDWNKESPGDFEIEIGMNTVTGIAEILDWEIITLEGKKF